MKKNENSAIRNRKMNKNKNSEIRNQKSEIVKVLLIEDNPGDARLVRETLKKVGDASFDLEHVDALSKGLECIAKGGIDVVLLDLSLPDSHGIDTFHRVHAIAPEVPVVVFSGLADESVAFKTVQEGAQDYLLKDKLDIYSLARSISYSIERNRLQAKLRSMALKDELTDLNNRRGFTLLAQQQIKIANRTKRWMVLLFIDLDNMKWINDNLGHHEGDRALVDLADILKRTFRESDIVARIGGDEFAVLAIKIRKGSVNILKTRLQANIDAHNVKANRQYDISISMGTTPYNPKNPCNLDELLIHADTLMYEQKKNKQRSS